jgi:hypothetical protein
VTIEAVAHNFDKTKDEAYKRRDGPPASVLNVPNSALTA